MPVRMHSSVQTGEELVLDNQGIMALYWKKAGTQCISFIKITALIQGTPAQFSLILVKSENTVCVWCCAKTVF